MRRISQFAVLVVGLMSLFAMLSSSAGAVTWHNSGDTAYTAAGGVGTLGVTGVNLACGSSSATGTATATSLVGNTVDIGTATIVFGSCTLSGIPTAVHCTATLTATSEHFTEPITVVTGDADITCSVSQFGAEICMINGATVANYSNPASPSTFGKVTVPASTTLRTSNGAAGSCPLGINEPSSLTAQTFTITSASGGATSPHLGPRIIRTA